MPDITISLNSGQAKRVRDAITDIERLSTPADDAYIRDWLIKQLNKVTRSAEREKGRREADRNITDLGIS